MGWHQKHEAKFNQDLDLDGEIDLNEALTAIASDEGDALLKEIQNTVFISMMEAH